MCDVGELKGAKVMESSVSEARISPGEANKSCREKFVLHHRHEGSEGAAEPADHSRLGRQSC